MLATMSIRLDELAIYLLSLMTSHSYHNTASVAIADWNTCTTYQHLNSEGIGHKHLLYLGNLHFMQMMDRPFPNPNPQPVILIGLDNDNKDKSYNSNSISASDSVNKVAPPMSITPYNDPPLSSPSNILSGPIV